MTDDTQGGPDAPGDGTDGDDDEYERARASLVDRLQRREDLSERTLEAIAAVPRHAFVPAAERDRAYADRPLPIGEGQTISAPHMVAVMVEVLDLEPGESVLEIGTGCGYHAAVTAAVVGDGNVFSVEYHESLAEAARDRLAELGVDVRVRTGDGHEGWPAHAPYDAAYLTCAAPSVPEAVVDQTREGGRIVAPIGRGHQRLVELRVGADGVVDRRRHGGVRFVEMRGG